MDELLINRTDQLHRDNIEAIWPERPLICDRIKAGQRLSYEFCVRFTNSGWLVVGYWE
jgi:hypothetical protein